MANKIKSLNDVPAIMSYLQRIGAEPRSLQTAVVREEFGKYWKDLATIHFSRDGSTRCSAVQYEPTELEIKDIQAAISKVAWPQIKPIASIINPPALIANANLSDVFEFRNIDGLITMVQVRINDRDGGKAYVPFTYWDDDEWRMCEPDGPLPLFGIDKLKNATTVFIHEGAKAARHVQNMVQAETTYARKALAAHPWGNELVGAVHVGWIGGALSPARTDWAILQRQGIKRAYIVADNDSPGRKAVPAIAQRLKCPTFFIQFTDEWPRSFDLADTFPEEMFGDIDGTRFYIGPSFRSCLHPATWATDLVTVPGAKKPVAVLRDHFRDQWSYIEDVDVFVNNEMPETVRSEAVLNKMLAPFSHVFETSKLIAKAYSGRSLRLCYRPDNEGRLVTEADNNAAINLHTPTMIRSEKGDAGPWEEYLSYMFTHVEELHHMKRWLATLIAKPEVRMGYGLLLISESQGIGKTTLASAILAPLVGVRNTSFPGEANITSAFNDWAAQKRLVVINEIYMGSSWKAYQILKSIVSDREITVNQKYMRAYPIENWCHVIACSNSMRALKMEGDDRRWFYPEMTEVPWAGHKFKELRQWLASGGLSIIKHWAEEFGDYVQPFERAPMTKRKREMIYGSRSDAQREAVALAEALSHYEEPKAVLMKDVVSWCRANTQGHVYETDYELRKAMQEHGIKQFDERIKIGKRLEYVLANGPLVSRLERIEDKQARRDELRKAIVKCNDIMDAEM